MPRVLVGTSGYNYPEWRGTFYPEKFSTDKMLAYYAERFSTVEINYTFYRVPNEKLLAGWAAGTPDTFTFTLKAPRRITHDAKLQRCEDLTQAFCRTAKTLGSKLGVLLFQLPPTFKKDAAVLDAFTEMLPDGTRAAFEFRHPSWFDADVVRHPPQPQPRALRRRQREAERAVRDDGRLRVLQAARRGLPAGRYRAVGGVIRDLDGVQDAYVYFKHEEQGLGPDFAKRLIALL